MVRKRWIIAIWLILILLPMVMAFGCMGRMEEENVGEEGVEEEISLDVIGEDRQLLVRSENISDIVVNLYGIDNATSIIFNDIVAIGLEMAEGNSLTDEIKKMIKDTVLENDSSIKQVLITDNKKTFDGIESIVLSLLSGDKSYDDQVKEINQIIEKMR